MKITKYLKNNKIISFILVSFLIWIIFLIIFGVISERDPIFIDAISQSNVSSEYISSIPFLRYFLEPIIGLTYMLADVQFGILYGTIIFFIIFRIIIFIINRTLLKDSKKHKILFVYVENVINFFFITMMINLAVVIIIFLFGYFTYGFLFINHNWQVILQWSIFIQIVLLGVKIIYNLYIFFKPKLSLKTKKLTNNKNNKKSGFNFINTIKIIGREMKYIIIVVLFTATLIVCFLSIKFPTQNIVAVSLDTDEVLFDFHVHSTMSDGFLTPEERVEWYIEQGIHGAAFTDHQNTRGAQRALAYVQKMGYDFTVIIGQEYTCTTPPIHLNVFGLLEDLTPIEFQNDPYHPNCLNVSDMIKYVKSKGGYVIVNHYYAPDDPDMPFNYTQLMNWGVDGFEIANSGKLYPDEIRQFCIANNLTMLSTTDEHTNRELVAFMKIKLADPNNRSTTAIFQALKNSSNYEAIYIEKNSQLIISDPEDLGIFNFIGYLLNYFYNLDLFQSLSWILWSILIFMIGIYLVHKIEKIDISKLEKKIMK
ncbi:MAG: PHP domain-containing protein [Candidatus Helarchaeota archaeon]